METAVNPSLERIQQHADETASGAVDSKPVVMLNLLRFRELADFTDTDIAPPNDKLSGKKTYGIYSKKVLPMLWAVGGQVLWQGNARTTLIAPEGESWDEALLVYYPSRTKFLEMVTSQPYSKIVGYRSAALLDSRLVETQSVFLPKPVLAVAGVATRIKNKLFG